MSARPGVAYLVGAGPGDPGLLTARAIELIGSADVILYDRLIPDQATSLARSDCELVYVGKLPDRHALPQREIEELMVERAKAGKSVVRLKGGDPFVFGRGGEEAESLIEAGLPFEVVPGVTAGIAASAYAGIPVTHRDEASAVAFVTGHEDPTKEGAGRTTSTPLEYSGLASFPGTLVFYMGVGRLGEIAQELIDCGRDPDEPSAVIERGTLPGQRSVVAPLSRIAEEVAAAGIKPPAITVVGHVSKLSERIAWLQNRPLNGLRVVVTRARPQASGLADRLAELGAEPLQLPAIRIEPTLDTDEVASAAQAIDAYSLICLTSPNGANLLFEALAAAGKDARSLAGATVAAIGPGTADALRGHGVIADVIPEKFVAEELVAALDQVEVEGKRVLVARAAEARDVLPDALAEREAEVDVVALYRTVAEDLDDETIASASDADYVTFTSSSTVKNLLGALPGGSLPGSPRVVSIGPVTSETAREAGLAVDVEASRHDIEGLIEALVEDAAAHRS